MLQDTVLYQDLIAPSKSSASPLAAFLRPMAFEETPVAENPKLSLITRDNRNARLLRPQIFDFRDFLRRSRVMFE